MTTELSALLLFGATLLLGMPPTPRLARPMIVSSGSSSMIGGREKSFVVAFLLKPALGLRGA